MEETVAAVFGVYTYSSLKLLFLIHTQVYGVGSHAYEQEHYVTANHAQF